MDPQLWAYSLPHIRCYLNELAAMDHQPVLQAHNISKSFGHQHVLRELNLSLNDGECLVLMGANGAGKTTLTHILQGLLPADAGTVTIFGQTYQRGRGHILARIGVLMQETSLYKRYTVLETLQLFASFYNHRRPSNLMTIITALDLTAHQHTYLKDLSGGQKQKLYIATALVHQPSLLFLDEPTTGLDPVARRQIWTIIAELRRQGCAILLTTHYLDEAEQLADRLAILHKGKLLAEGSITSLIATFAPEQTMTIALNPADASAQATLITQLQAHPNVNRVHQEGPTRFKVTLASSMELPQLVELLSSRGIKPHQLTMALGSLEDVYRSLTTEAPD